MGSDLSTIDAELEALGDLAPEDVLALAKAFAPDIVDADPISLVDVDRALSALANAGSVVDAARAAPARAAAVEEPAPEPVARGARPLDSQEIALPEPVIRDELQQESREIPLDDPAPRSGSFEVAGETEPPSAPAQGAHTLEVLGDDFDDEEGALHEAEVPLELANSKALSRWETDRPRTDEAFDDEAGDREFAALFDEATSRSSLPAAGDASGLSSLEGGFAPNEDDTDIFDTRVLGLADEAPAEDAFGEELDSSEFEVVPEPQPAAPPQRASKPPEKRPSFIGRLFGRKEDRDGPQS